MRVAFSHLGFLVRSVAVLNIVIDSGFLLYCLCILYAALVTNGQMFGDNFRSACSLYMILWRLIAHCTSMLLLLGPSVSVDLIV